MLNLIYMSANVTFFEETPFFSSSMQDFNFVQQVLPIPSLDPLLSPIHEIPIMDTSQATSPTSPSSSPHTTHQYETHTETKLSSHMSHGESSASCPSPSAIHTTVPTDDGSRWPIALRKGI